MGLFREAIKLFGRKDGRPSPQGGRAAISFICLSPRAITGQASYVTRNEAYDLCEFARHGAFADKSVEDGLAERVWGED